MNTKIMLYILTSFNLIQIYCCDICCKPNLDDSTSSSNSGSKRNLKPTPSTRGNLDSGLPQLDLNDKYIDNLLKNHKKEVNDINDLMKNDQKLFEQRMLELDKKYIMNKKIHEENMRNNNIDHINKMKEMDNVHNKEMEKIDINHNKEMGNIMKERFDLHIRKLSDKKEALIALFGTLEKEINKYSHFKTLEERFIGYEEIFNKTYESAKSASKYEIQEAIDFISDYDRTPNYKAVYLGVETYNNITDALSNYKNNLEIHKDDINSFNTENEKLKSKKAEYLKYNIKLINENKVVDENLKKLTDECYELFVSVCKLAEKISAYNDDAYNFKDKYMNGKSDEDNFRVYMNHNS